MASTSLVRDLQDARVERNGGESSDWTTGGSSDGGSDESSDGDNRGDDNACGRDGDSSRVRDDEGKFVRRFERSGPVLRTAFPIIQEWPDVFATGFGRCWLVRSPVERGDRNKPTFKYVTVYRAAADLPVWEVYPRVIVGWLPKLRYPTRKAAFDSLRALFNASRDGRCEPIDTTAPYSSWRGQMPRTLSDAFLTQVLKYAARSIKDPERKISRGHVSFVSELPLRADAWYQKMQRNIVRHYRRDGARHVISCMKQVGTKKMKGVLANMTTAQVAVARRLAELNEGAGASGRSTRLRVGYGLGAPHLWPRKYELSAARKALLDDRGHAKHSFLTETAEGIVSVWRYVEGSAIVGARRYRNDNGFVRRLRTPWRITSPLDPDAAVPSSDIPPISIEEFFDSGAGPPPPSQPDGSATGEVGRGTATPAAYGSDAIPLSLLQVHSASMLETLTGDDPIEVVALVLDAAYSIGLALVDGRRKNLTVSDVEAAPDALLTLGADGGPLRGQSVLAVTVTLSTPVLAAGRTNLIGLAYVFASEKSVSSAVYRFVAGLLRNVMGASFAVKALPEAGETVAPVDDPGVELVSVPVAVNAKLHVCCTFCFLFFLGTGECGLVFSGDTESCTGLHSCGCLEL